MSDFDEGWYLNTYMDVQNALAKGLVRSALDHYLRHGRKEGRLPNAGRSKSQIVHIHVAKTAGTSVRSGFENLGKRVLIVDPGFSYNHGLHASVDVFSGHFGYRGATTINGQIVTVLREPVDRFLSYYFHLASLYNTGAEISERTALAAKYRIDQFVTLYDCPHFVEDLFNATVWQMAYGTRFAERLFFRQTHAPSDEELLMTAVNNVSQFAVVGFQDDIGTFCDDVYAKFGIPLSIGNENVGARRPLAEEISLGTRQKIENWVYLDTELFRHFRGRHCRYRAPTADQRSPTT